MFTVQTEKIVQRPVPEVFAFVADLRNASQWQSSVEEVRRLTPGSLGVDTEHVLVRRVLGRRLESQVHNTEYVPNQHFALEADYGSFAGHVEYRFAPAHSDKFRRRRGSHTSHLYHAVRHAGTCPNRRAATAPSNRAGVSAELCSSG